MPDHLGILPARLVTRYLPARIVTGGPSVCPTSALSPSPCRRTWSLETRNAAARFISNRSIGPRELRIGAWAWLCANTDNIDEKRRYLDAILGLDPSLEWAQAALAGIRQRYPGEHEHT